MEILKEKLPSGLTVILAPMSGTKTITEVFMARAGWQYEWPEIYGLSHFIEHMLFKGTAKYPAPQDISKEVENRGGMISAFTGREYTGYWVKLSVRFIDIVHNLLSDMVLNSKFDPEEIDRERGTILGELHILVDEPIGRVSTILWPKLLYGDQPAGQSGLGTEETIRALKREQFIDYMEKLYVASNSMVCIAGCIDEPQKTIDDIAKYFDKIGRAEPAIQKPPVAERQREPKILLQDKETAQTYVCLGTRGYGVNNPNKYPLQVLNVILGGNTSSWLFKEVRERRGLAYYVFTTANFFSDTGYLTTWAGLRQEKIIEAIEVILEEFRKLKKEKVSEGELRGAKDFLIGQQEIFMEDSRAVAINLIQEFALTDEIETLEERNQKIEAVTADDIQRVAQDLFRNKVLNLAMIGPHKKEKEEIYKILKF